ncbi:succinylglutamate desuccinylase/aspartoacylase family protein [Rhizobium sp. BK399]|uniref:succinylglutamate desuccinylase/aspartoacylase family protein n=1 Tax=Rhizobium sp. BK399 TaxID=2587063 RepID=UPI00161895E7|nr:succinylglutamate desuccinylase/aspartoacylase family protein [Rhizobium sp. BK399]MBB3543745.1 hypothetical protein [Rhizobium sp. BK399]
MLETEYQIKGRGIGTAHLLKSFTFGDPNARPHVYIQGGLHADEGPGMLVSRMTCEKLLILEQTGKISGRVTVVPVANPIGLSQFGLGQQEGRFDVYDGRNFNRHYPDLTLGVVSRLDCLLGEDPKENVAIIREALRQEVDAWPADTPADLLRKRILQTSVDADYVLDLHCDGEAEVHIYTQPEFIEALEALSAFLKARAVLIAEVSGDNPFDEAVSQPWVALRQLYGRHAIPVGCVATTIELRGRSDVQIDLAAQDADAIIQFLIAIGVVQGEMQKPPEMLCEPTPLSGSQALISPAAGLLSYRCQLGQFINRGDIVADIIDPLTGRIDHIEAATSGIFYARADTRIAEVGKRLGKIAGKDPFRTGLLLSP